MASWRKCRACSRVQALTEFDDDVATHVCKSCTAAGRTPGDAPTSKRSSAESVRAYRERTGNAYGKAYAKAKRMALQALADAHAEEFAQLLEKERINVGLGPTRST